jgi:hypothetical protein
LENLQAGISNTPGNFFVFFPKPILSMRTYLLLCIWLCSQLFCLAQTELPTVDSFTKDMRKHEGLFDFYWDERSGKVWLEISSLNQEFLYQISLPAGIGSNDIGLDRGQLGGTMVVKFIHSGPKILLEQVNYGYRAISDNAAEKISVAEAFAQSIIGGFTITAVQGERLLVDITDFLLRDAHNYALGSAHSVANRLKEASQGTYQLDKSRSAIYLERTKSFPENTEFEATLTFGLKEGEEYGDLVASVVPTGNAITVRQHHSFIKLPDDGYQMRISDPGAGYHGISFYDYASPIDEPIQKHFIHRHRLQRQSEQSKKPVSPIVYYVDPGAPEPIRSALIEGASWWNQAFEAAGYENAFQVKLLPEEADPMDVRYNVIQWVHRSTRGWSYGMTVSDPRTGEIIKGHVSLGSLRVRQDFMIAQGLINGYKEGQRQDPRMLEMALSRLRQLSAHEVGHTLGLLHNFAGSSNGRSTVMDYPHPMITIEGNTLSFENAYDNQIGIWDKQAIKYGYQQFPGSVNEHMALSQIIESTQQLGLRYITDRDARPTGGAHPHAHLWDNGEDPTAELKRILKVRTLALDTFGEDNIAPNRSWSELEDVLVPLYLSHRYQIEAVSKLIGGLEYHYAVKGDGQAGPRMVDPKIQIKAAQALMATLDPKVLAIPEHIREIIPPKSPNYSRGRENFGSRTGVVFDPVAAAEGIASQTISLMLHPERATRLVQQQSFDSGQIGLDRIIDLLIDNTWKQVESDMYLFLLNGQTSQLVLDQLMDLARDLNASHQARAVAHSKIISLQSWLKRSETGEAHQLARNQLALNKIDLYLNHPEALPKKLVIEMPDGSPIGMEVGCMTSW